jgi:hypothetical protein
VERKNARISSNGPLSSSWILSRRWDRFQIAQAFAFGGEIDKMRKQRYIPVTHHAGIVEGGLTHGGTESL